MSEQPFPQVGMIVVEKVVRESVPLVRPREGFGETIGQAIDQHLAQCAERGEEVQKVEIHLDREAWGAMAHEMRQGSASLPVVESASPYEADWTAPKAKPRR